MINEPDAGGFHDGDDLVDPYQPGGELRGTHDSEIREANVESPDSNLGRAISMVTGHFGMPASVVYPGCGDHVIDSLFPGSEVVYADPSEEGIVRIRSVIGDAVRAQILGAEDMAVRSPERFDMLFSLNTHARMGDQLQCLKPGGLVFCNNYFGTRDAEEALVHGCTLEGVMLYVGERGEEQVLQTDRVEEYAEFDDSLPEHHIGCRLKKGASYYVLRKPAPSQAQE